MIRAIIVDDNKSSRDTLNNYILKYCKDVKIETQAEGVNSGLESIYKCHPDLIFLDVEMKDGTGFDLLKQIKKIDFKIIFVTGFEKYAVMAFKYSASDYLLKPVNINELVEAVEKVKVEINLKTGSQNISALMDMVNHQDKEIETIVITDSKGFKILHIKSIIKCKADGSCTHFYLTDNSAVVSSKNLGYFDYLLENKFFLKVHKSNFINLQHVKGYISSDQTIQLSGNLTAPLGDTFKKAFLQHFNKN